MYCACSTSALRGAGGCASSRWELPFYFLRSHKSLRGFRFIYSGRYFVESTVGTDLCQDPWNDRFTWLPSVWETYLFPCKTIKGRQGRPIDVRIVHIIGAHESDISNSTVMTLYTSSLFPSFSLRCLFIIQYLIAFFLFPLDWLHFNYLYMLEQVIIIYVKLCKYCLIIKPQWQLFPMFTLQIWTNESLPLSSSRPCLSALWWRGSKPSRAKDKCSVIISIHDLKALNKFLVE